VAATVTINDDCEDYMADERLTEYRRVERIQARIRQHGFDGDGLPPEDEQFLIWLDDEDGYFFVPLKTAQDRTMELELIGVLREAFMHDRRVKLGYRLAYDNKYISAAWVEQA
jgi:hypothetical protein